MELQINAKWRIRTLDVMNLAVQELVKGKPSKAEAAVDLVDASHFWQTRGYYGTLESALNGYSGNRVLYSEAKGLAEVRTLLQEIHFELRSVAGGLRCDAPSQTQSPPVAAKETKVGS